MPLRLKVSKLHNAYASVGVKLWIQYIKLCADAEAFRVPLSACAEASAQAQALAEAQAQEL